MTLGTDNPLSYVEGIVGDEVSRLGPPEGFRLGVSDVDVPENGLPKPASAAMNPSSELLVGRLGEPPLMVRMRRQRVCRTGGTFFPSIASVSQGGRSLPSVSIEEPPCVALAHTEKLGGLTNGDLVLQDVVKHVQLR